MWSGQQCAPQPAFLQSGALQMCQSLQLAGSLKTHLLKCWHTSTDVSYGLGRWNFCLEEEGADSFCLTWGSNAVSTQSPGL